MCLPAPAGEVYYRTTFRTCFAEGVTSLRSSRPRSAVKSIKRQIEKPKSPALEMDYSRPLRCQDSWDYTGLTLPSPLIASMRNAVSAQVVSDA
jgi:hypothetical protein